jgi:hypothetical protein
MRKKIAFLLQTFPFYTGRWSKSLNFFSLPTINAFRYLVRYCFCVISGRLHRPIVYFLQIIFPIAFWMSLFYPFLLTWPIHYTRLYQQFLDFSRKIRPQNSHGKEGGLPVAVMHIPAMEAHKTENEHRKLGTNDTPVKSSQVKQR